MALNFDKLPTEKPNSNSIEAGRYLAKIEKTEMVTKDTSKYLRVTFKTKDGAFVSENYFDSDKPFVLYKLGRLLKATGVVLEGTGALEDVAKLIKNKKVYIEVAINDRGYAGLDYSDKKEGIYPATEEAEASIGTKVELDKDVETAIADEDDDF